MKKNVFLWAGLCLAVVGVNAQAADLRVKGSIAPTSCSFTITTSTIDYGRIDPNSLNVTNYTKLAKRGTPFVIKCSSPAMVGVKTLDNRASTKVPGMMQAIYNSTYNDLFNYGLGHTARGEKIGGYVIFMENLVADGRAIGLLRSVNNGTTWGRTDPVLAQPPQLASWYSGTTYTPAKAAVISGQLNAQAVINKKSALTLTSEIKLDGHATLELVYL
jgi:type 1 fimbria pilin